MLGLGQDHRLTIHKVPYTLKDEILARACDLELLRERIKITADLLEITARHIDNRSKLNIRHLNIVHIGIEQLHHPRVRGLLLGVLGPNSQLVRIGGREKQGQRIRIGQRLDQLEQIDHVDAQNELVRAEEILEFVGIESQICQDYVGLIHIDNLDARGIKLNIGLGQNLLEPFDQSAKGARLNCADLKEVAIRVCLTSRAHLKETWPMGFRSI